MIFLHRLTGQSVLPPSGEETPQSIFASLFSCHCWSRAEAHWLTSKRTQFRAPTSTTLMTEFCRYGHFTLANSGLTRTGKMEELREEPARTWFPHHLLSSCKQMTFKHSQVASTREHLKVSEQKMWQAFYPSRHLFILLLTLHFPVTCKMPSFGEGSHRKAYHMSVYCLRV